jgi:hypothetical protein
MKNSTQLSTAWTSVMDESVNPLKNYSLPTAHMMMQLLAWMWSAIFGFTFSSYYLFGVLAGGHILVVAGLFITLMVFRGAEEKS